MHFASVVVLYILGRYLPHSYTYIAYDRLQVQFICVTACVRPCVCLSIRSLAVAFLDRFSPKVAQR